MKLSDYVDALAYETAFALAAFTNPRYPIGALGAVSVQACAKLRTLAIIALVTEADHRAYTHNLVRSGRCRLSYLQRLRDSGHEDRLYSGAARVQPFLDAVAAADFELARQIAALSRSECLPACEYEDDFCHAQVAHAIVAPVSDVKRIDALFARWETALQGQPDPRFAVMRALAQRDAPAFDPAFEALVQHRADTIEQDRARGAIEEHDTVAARQLDVDGLALLRMALQLGLQTQQEYAGCPSIALQVTREPLAAEW
jgi:hypothetical protein